MRKLTTELLNEAYEKLTTRDLTIHAKNASARFLTEGNIREMCLPQKNREIDYGMFFNDALVMELTHLAIAKNFLIWLIEGIDDGKRFAIKPELNDPNLLVLGDYDPASSDDVAEAGKLLLQVAEDDSIIPAWNDSDPKHSNYLLSRAFETIVNAKRFYDEQIPDCTVSRNHNMIDTVDPRNYDDAQTPKLVIKAYTQIVLDEVLAHAKNGSAPFAVKDNGNVFASAGSKNGSGRFALFANEKLLIEIARLQNARDFLLWNSQNTYDVVDPETSKWLNAHVLKDQEKTQEFLIKLAASNDMIHEQNSEDDNFIEPMNIIKAVF